MALAWLVRWLLARLLEVQAATIDHLRAELSAGHVRELKQQALVDKQQDLFDQALGMLEGRRER